MNASDDPTLGRPAVSAVDGVPMVSMRSRRGPARAGVVILPEIWGLSSYLVGVCDGLAELGFDVVAPSLFDEGDCDSTDDADDARRRLGRLDDRRVVERFELAASVASIDPQNLIVIGFCLGGRCALQLALDGMCRATVAFYPTGLDEERFAGLSPLAARLLDTTTAALVIVGDQDDHVPPPILEVLRRASRSSSLEVEVVPGVGHAFHNPTRPGYVPGAAGTAWSRALAWIEAQLGEPTVSVVGSAHEADDERAR